MTDVTEIMQATEGTVMGSKRPPMWPISKAVAGAAIAAVVALGAVGSGTGCTASGDEVKPDPLRLYFPTGAVVSPDGTKLFVTNANSDLTYDSGAISVLPLASIDAVIAGWLADRPSIPEAEGARGTCWAEDDREKKKDKVPCCAQDPEFNETLVCIEELFLQKLPRAGVRIGNFASEIALQDLGDGALRLVVPTRGDPSISWADWRPELDRLSCTDADDPFDLCDDAHRLSFVHGDSDVGSIPEEPFGVFADSAGQFAMVTHLTTGAVTLIDSPRDGLAQVADIQEGIFEPDPQGGLPGATGVAGRTPHAPGNIVYVGSRSEDRVQTFTVGRPLNDAPPFLLMGDWFFLDGVGNDGNVNNRSADTRGMAFSPSGDRLYLINRRPPSIQIYDTSLGATGVPRNVLVGAADICRQASSLTIVDSGDGERAYLTCFQDGQIYVIDPRGHGRVEDIITVGRGPYAVAAAPGGQRLYVTNFLEDSIAVVDLTPGSPTRNRVVLRIGEPRPL